MKKILYFTITYICIGLFLIFLPSVDISFWLWLAIGITLLILPIIGLKILKNNYNISKEALIATSFVLLLSILIGTFKFFEPPQDILIAMTKNPQKASQIQELLTTQKQETIRRYVYGENNNPAKIGIFIPRTSSVLIVWHRLLKRAPSQSMGFQKVISQRHLAVISNQDLAVVIMV